MSLRPVLVTTKPENFTLPDAVAAAQAAGVRMVESPNRCLTFTNRLAAGGEFRVVGSLTWNFELKRLSAWIRSDATRDETTTLLVQAVREARRTAPVAGVFWFEFMTKVGTLALQLDVARPLSDYGGDLVLVVRIPDHVPEGVRQAHTL